MCGTLVLKLGGVGDGSIMGMDRLSRGQLSGGYAYAGVRRKKNQGSRGSGVLREGKGSQGYELHSQL